MGIFSAAPNRTDERKIYLPADVNGMAHRSFASPDGRSVLLVEMDLTGWRPCRLVPADGSSPGTQVGPVPSQCTDAAWSPDGQWIYVAANRGTGFHIWRQRVSGGTPEPVTSGATEEQGLAFAPDGGSFVTSIGERQSTLWLHAGETRQLTFEGFAYTPLFSADRTRLYYLQRSQQNRRFVSGELWTVDLETGARERLLGDQLMESFDVSRDGKRVVFVGVDPSGLASIWEAELDGRTPPRRVSSLRSVRVLYGPNDDILFVGGETATMALYRIPRDRSALQKVISQPTAFLYDVSPDDKWVAAWVGTAVAFYPVDGGNPVTLCLSCGTAGDENRGVTPPALHWSRDGKFLYLHSAFTRRTYVLALHAGEVVPRISSAFRNIDAAAEAIGARAIADPRASVSDDPSVYVFPRVLAHRNIYRVSVQ